MNLQVNTLAQVVEKSTTEAYANLKALVASAANDAKINDSSVVLTLITVPDGLPRYTRLHSFTELINTERDFFYVVISFDITNDDPPKTYGALLSYVLSRRVAAHPNITGIKGAESGIKWLSYFILNSKDINDPEHGSIQFKLQENLRTYNIFIRYDFSDK